LDSGDSTLVQSQQGAKKTGKGSQKELRQSSKTRSSNKIGNKPKWGESMLKRKEPEEIGDKNQHLSTERKNTRAESTSREGTSKGRRSAEKKKKKKKGRGGAGVPGRMRSHPQSRRAKPPDVVKTE